MEASLIGRSQRQGIKPKIGKCKMWCILASNVKAKKGVKQGPRINYMCRDFGIGCAWKIASSGILFVSILAHIVFLIASVNINIKNTDWSQHIVYILRHIFRRVRKIEKRDY
jgi:hypothetical protein